MRGRVKRGTGAKWCTKKGFIGAIPHFSLEDGFLPGKKDELRCNFEATTEVPNIAKR